MKIGLALIGHDNPYQVQSLIKMFDPQARFTPQTKPPYVITRIKRDRLLVVVQIGQRPVCRHLVLPDYTDQKEKQNALCRLLYHALCEAFDTRPPWGMLTGVRPIKRVRALLKRGMKEDEVTSALQKTWDVSGQKAALALAVAKVQLSLDLRPNPRQYSLYVSIPFCPSRCRYCSFVSQSIEKRQDLIEPYLALLKTELTETANLARQFSLQLQTIYIGGGTPTVLSPKQLAQLLGHIERCFPASSALEYTVEAGRPDTVTPQKLAVLRDFGVNRVCINPQSFNDEVLAFAGRTHSKEQTLRALALANKAGFSCVNMDLIAGLFGESKDSFLQSVQTAIALAPQNITVHTLSVKRASSQHQEQMHTPLKVNADLAQMVQDSQELLSRCGYHPYYLYRQKSMVENLENVGWSRAGFESRYNIAIMEEDQTILACGAGSSSKVAGKGVIKRFFNSKYPMEYCQNPEKLTAKTQKLAEAIAKSLQAE